MQRLEIDASTWAELNHLLDVALDQPASQRDQWIETLGPQYAALKNRVLGRNAEAVETLRRAERVLSRSPISSDRKLRQLAAER